MYVNTGAASMSPGNQTDLHEEYALVTTELPSSPAL